MPKATVATKPRFSSADIALPPSSISVSQDREWCVVHVDGKWKKIRFHDYSEIYEIPGLYEKIFYEVLGCSSPETVGQILRRCLEDRLVSARELRVLDLGAGNGMVGEELAGFGVQRIVGVDIIREAAEAARRDRSEFYDEYFVLDMTDLSDLDLTRLTAYGFNCLTCVAALGFGDIPPAAFANAFNLVESGGWIAFNIKSEFLSSDHSCGFARLIRRMLDERLLTVHARQQYPHRYSTSGEPLLYNVLVGQKKRDVPGAWEL
jgi:SAM-dependent methyltransferase